MIVYSVRYRYTEYVRTPTFGGMDSEPSHTQVSERTLNVLVQDQHMEPMVRTWISNYAGNKRDEAFEILEISKLCDVQTIITAQGRL